MLAAIIKRYQGEMTQEEYAELLGITQGTLSLIFRGRRGVGPAVLGAFARKFPQAGPEIAAALAGQPLPEREMAAVAS